MVLRRSVVIVLIYNLEIFENGFLQPRPSLAFAHMEIHIENDADNVQDQVTYLYKYPLFCIIFGNNILRSEQSPTRP